MSALKTALDAISARCPRPLPAPRADQCEYLLCIGIFMDGTNNNKHVESKSANSNVTRLWDAYREVPQEGFFRYYVSGVGTPFTEISEAVPPGGGGRAGEGGEARIVYALLQVLNSVHAFLNNDQQRYEQSTVAALCTDTPMRDNGSPLTSAQQSLKGLGLPSGLVGNADLRNRFIRTEAAKLQQQLSARTTVPKICGIYLDIFGFSRGAAEARVFTSWLHDLMLVDGKLFGVESYVRMLGLFDTVSSVGRTDALGSHGHNSWGQEKDLRIHRAVKNCVHFVALHELRTNFPCDSIAGPGGAVAETFSEHFYPGVHSDVGGSYAAGEQGKGVREVLIDPRVTVREGGGVKFVLDDSKKLSQVPLNEMYQAAKACCQEHEGSPWIDLESTEGDNLKLPQRFAMSRNGQGTPEAQSAIQNYFVKSGVKTNELTVIEALRQHGEVYLAWRYHVGKAKRFDSLPSVRYAKEVDKKGYKYYLQGEDILRTQLVLLGTSFGSSSQPNDSGEANPSTGFNRHADDIFVRLKKSSFLQDLEQFFDDWVHDSYAGFIGQFDGIGPSFAGLGGMLHLAAEGQRYVRWRGLYCGGNDQLNARLPEGFDANNNSRRTA
jgi:hypothetical protein